MLIEVKRQNMLKY